ncbi:MAG: TonB-dependent receptor [Pseudomonadales bacterium]|nr:TonB-dependent receptor [Pseudomonadales bacterium]
MLKTLFSFYRKETYLPAVGVMVGLGFCGFPLSSQAEDAVLQMETVIVKSESIETVLQKEQEENPGATTIVDGDELYQRSVNNVADAMRYAPSVWAESVSGGDNVFFSSRGSNLDATDYDQNGIKLLQDGLPVTTADGNNHNRFIDPLSARYMVVAPGANALTYGASTLGGAINFISPTARDVAPHEIFMSAGNNGLTNVRATAATVADQFDGMITVEDKQWGGYRHHSESDRQGVYGNVGWKISDALENRAFFTYVKNDQQLPAPLTKAQYQDDPDQAGAAALEAGRAKNVESWRIADKTTWKIDERSSLEFGISHEQQHLNHPIVQPIMVDFDGPGPMQPVEVFSLLVDTDHRESGATVRYNIQLGAHDLLMGMDYAIGEVNGGNYRNYFGEHNGLSEVVNNNADTLQLYAMDRWALDERWTLIYGAQAIQAGRDAEVTHAATGTVRNPQEDYNSVNPRAGITYDISNNSQLFANVSRLFEPPTNFELADDVRGNHETLKPMYGSVIEVGTRGDQSFAEHNYWHWETTLYYAKIRDEILSVDDPLAPGNSLTTNIDKTVHAGVEALLGASFAVGNQGSSLDPKISITYNRFRFDDDANYGDNHLPAAPGYAVRGELLYRQADGFYVGPTFDVIGSRYADFTNHYKVDGYALLGLRGGYDAKTWEVFAELKNVTDKNYVSTVAVMNNANDNAAVLNPGAPRSAVVGLRVLF